MYVCTYVGRYVMYVWYVRKDKGKDLPYSLPSVGPGADPGVQAVSLQVTWSYPLGGRLPLLSVRPALPSQPKSVTAHWPVPNSCLVTEAHACEQLAQGCYLKADRPRFEPVTFRIDSEHSTINPHRPHTYIVHTNAHPSQPWLGSIQSSCVNVSNTAIIRTNSQNLK